MQLDHIKTEACPVCGAPVLSQSLKSNFHGGISVHVSRGRSEVRAFACGLYLEYVPNFERVQTHGQCQFDPALAERNARRKDLSEKLIAIVEVADVDDLHRNHLIGLLNDF